MDVPLEFIERYRALLGGDLNDFLDCLSVPLRPSLRVNTLKVSEDILLKALKEDGISLKPIPWTPSGYFYQGEGMGNSIWYFLGYVYLQGACSMIPPLLLDLKEGDVVLDMAASPGSKTTQMAGLMGNKGVIVANDVSVRRLRSLRFNLDRLGVVNTAVSQMDGRRFGRLAPNFFDKVLLDAPCSAEGVTRKDPDLLATWSIHSIRRLARIQEGLIISAFKSLRPGGILVYSTCTLAPEEDEGVVDALCRAYREAEVLGIQLPCIKVREGIRHWDGRDYKEQVRKCIRIYPHDNDTEGFFVAKIRKNPDAGGGMPAELREDRAGERWELDRGLARRFGLEDLSAVDFTRKGGKIWAMSRQLSSFDFPHLLTKGLPFARELKTGYKLTTNGIQLFGGLASRNTVGLSREEVERYIRGNDVEVDSGRIEGITDGQVIVSWGSFPIGSGLLKGTRLKNQIPRYRRIVG
ncbi:MAG TPA: NOL1/NOP2/sun family putative RNA methylase [Candidatus Latescibacteria bacterium]|nr:NOL1/NOP2/sun family putative RNA methylase [Candidatus Latescibacterota bacterium]